MNRQILGISLVFVLVAILLGTVLTRRMTRRLGQLAKYMNDYGKRKTEKEIKIRGGGREVVDLSHSFNSMIKERDRAEEALRASEGKFYLLSEQSMLGIVIIQYGQVQYANEAFSNIAGYSQKDVLSWKADEYIKVIHPDHQAMFAEEFLNTSENGSDAVHFQCRIVTKSDTEKWIEIFSRSIRYHSRTANMATLIDITESKASQEREKMQQQQLMQADKLVSLGVLVAGIGHEINNPNHTIMSNSALITEAWKSITPILEAYYEENGDFLMGGLSYKEMRQDMIKHLEGISGGALRIDTIVSELKKFSRHEEYELNADIEINRVLESAILLSRSFITKTTSSFHVVYADNLPLLKGSLQKLEQVILNLIQNACQALRSREDAIYMATSYDQEKQRIVVTVHDEGVGIRSEDLIRVEDPFFTTKRKEGGTGLGLYISSSIIEDHHGALSIASEPGKGTTVTVTLPAE
jgi:PAS domain S-box-containing protein